MKNEKEGEFFDDCEICQLMKKSAKGTTPSEPERLEAFKRAKNKGAIVGGSVFTKDKDQIKF